VSELHDDDDDSSYGAEAEPSRLRLVVETPTGERSFMLMGPDLDDLSRLVDAAGSDAFAARLQDATRRSEAYRASVGEQEVMRSVLGTAEDDVSPALLAVLAAVRGDI
jgi:hypothetical protein